MLTASEIAALIERGEIAWPGELRGDGLLLPLALSFHRGLWADRCA